MTELQKIHIGFSHKDEILLGSTVCIHYKQKIIYLMLDPRSLPIYFGMFCHETLNMAVPSTEPMKYLPYRGAFFFNFFQYAQFVKSLTLDVYMTEGILMSTYSQIMKNKSIGRPHGWFVISKMWSFSLFIKFQRYTQFGLHILRKIKNFLEDRNYNSKREIQKWGQKWRDTHTFTSFSTPTCQGGNRLYFLVFYI